MASPNGTRAVVVGVDGSDAALAAAQWAIDEAVDREVPLRLVHAIGIARDPSLPFDFYLPEIKYGEAALRTASSTVAAGDKTVKVETDLLWEQPDTALIAESRGAAMVALGAVGTGCVTGRLCGSSAAAVAEGACCPVAVVRQRTADVLLGPDWIVVAVDDRVGNDVVFAHAIGQARLRQAPILAVGTAAADTLDRRVTRWRRACPDVHIYPVCTQAGTDRFLTDHADECVQLAVVGAGDRSLVTSARCSVLVVR